MKTTPLVFAYAHGPARLCRNTIKSTRPFFGLMVLLCLISARPASADILFRDLFANGAVANSDSATGYWTTTNDTGASVAESGGKLTFSSSASGVKQADIHSALTSNYNFLRTEGLTLVIKGFAFSGQSTLSFQLAATATRAATDQIEIKADD